MFSIVRISVVFVLAALVSSNLFALTDAELLVLVNKVSEMRNWDEQLRSKLEEHPRFKWSEAVTPDRERQQLHKNSYNRGPDYSAAITQFRGAKNLPHVYRLLHTHVLIMKTEKVPADLSAEKTDLRQKILTGLCEVLHKLYLEAKETAKLKGESFPTIAVCDEVIGAFKIDSDAKESKDQASAPGAGAPVDLFFHRLDFEKTLRDQVPRFEKLTDLETQLLSSLDSSVEEYFVEKASGRRIGEYSQLIGMFKHASGTFEEPLRRYRDVHAIVTKFKAEALPENFNAKAKAARTEIDTELCAALRALYPNAQEAATRNGRDLPPISVCDAPAAASMDNFFSAMMGGLILGTAMNVFESSAAFSKASREFEALALAEQQLQTTVFGQINFLAGQTSPRNIAIKTIYVNSQVRSKIVETVRSGSSSGDLAAVALYNTVHSNLDKFKTEPTTPDLEPILRRSKNRVAAKMCKVLKIFYPIAQRVTRGGVDLKPISICDGIDLEDEKEDVKVSVSARPGPVVQAQALSNEAPKKNAKQRRRDRQKKEKRAAKKAEKTASVSDGAGASDSDEGLVPAPLQRERSASEESVAAGQTKDDSAAPIGRPRSAPSRQRRLSLDSAFAKQRVPVAIAPHTRAKRSDRVAIWNHLFNEDDRVFFNALFEVEGAGSARTHGVYTDDDLITKIRRLSEMLAGRGMTTAAEFLEKTIGRIEPSHGPGQGAKKSGRLNMRDVATACIQWGFFPHDWNARNPWGWNHYFETARQIYVDGFKKDEAKADGGRRSPARVGAGASTGAAAAARG